MFLVTCTMSFLGVLCSTASSSLFHSIHASFAGTRSWNTPPSLWSKGNQGRWVPRCGWSFKDANKVPLLQTSEWHGFRTPGEMKITLQPFCTRWWGEWPDKQVILSDISLFWRVLGCKLCQLFQDHHCKLWTSKQTSEGQDRLPVPSV